jgi:hypothetical protein
MNQQNDEHILQIIGHIENKTFYEPANIYHQISITSM